ncbi:TonB-dependent receptor [Microbulbifer sp. TYP-18]|uniref:TonB-dependent receptor domain-containing protein n=1 Tax=Microbulbifer sp. TYP-18 TaxID=3230024 RepID=UPI0034C68AAD
MTKQLRALLVLASLGTLPEGAIGACPEAEIKLPAGKLSKSLIELGRRCQVSVLVRASAANGHRIPAQTLSTDGGDFETVLRQLLANTPFSYQFSGPTAVAVFPRPSEPPQDREVLPTVETEEVTVRGSRTGTHLRHPHLDEYAPIDLLTREELELTGAQTLAELLKFLPAISGNSTSTAVNHNYNGTATAMLRGLPASNTLVLLNGRRIISNDFDSGGPDLNSIPLSMVDRIEILKDVASAVYGSDAVAGVVNIIPRNDFEGLSVNTYYGSAEAGDQKTKSHHITWGTTGDRGHVMVNLAQYRRGGILSRDRNRSASADSRLMGGEDRRSPATPNGFIALGDLLILTATNDNGSHNDIDNDSQNDIIADGPDDSSSSSNNYRRWTQEDLYDYRQDTTALVPAGQKSAYVEANLDLSNGTLFFIDAMAVRTESEFAAAPTPVFTRFDNGDLTLAADNIYNPFGIDITDIRKRVLELGPREQQNHTDNWRLNSGLKGAWDDWQWDLALSLHYTGTSERITNLIDPNRLVRGLKGPDICSEQSGCIPVNLVGPPGSIDRAQLGYIRGESRTEGSSRMGALTFVANGALGSYSAGDIPAALGIEVRREAIDLESSDALGLSYIGSSASGSALGHRIIGEIFTEVSLPLLSERLWLDTAVRVSDYSDFGNTTNPKFALRWRPHPSVMIRASYASGFRAPTLLDMHQRGYQSQEFLFDPCTRTDSGQLPGCRGRADTTRIQYLTTFGGNRELQPETSDNRSLGLHWAPQSLPGFSATLDIFDIRQNDVIDTSPQYLIDQNAYNGLFTDRVLRDEGGDIIEVLATRLNIGAREVRGADLALRYGFESGKLGQLRWALNAGRMHHYLNQAVPGEAFEDLAGTFADNSSGGAGSLPHWKANTGLYWKKDRWEGGYTIHYVGELRESFTLEGSAVTRQIDNWFSHDLQLAYSLPQKGWRFSLGVDNLLDEEPPFAAKAFSNNFDSRTYDLSGRYWYGTISFTL